MQEYIEYWTEKAKIYKINKQFEMAIKCYDRILQMKSSLQKENFWYHQGNFLMELGRYEESINYYDKDIELNKENFDSYFKKGITLYKLKKFVESNECFDKAFEIKYATFLKLTEQSKSLQNFKKFEKAIKNLDDAKKINMVPLEYWVYKGSVLCELKEYDKAIQCYDEVLNLEPKNTTVLYYKARTRILKNKIDKSGVVRKIT